LNEVAGVELKSAISRELASVGSLTNLVGKTSYEARHIVLGIPFQILNPRIDPNGGIRFTVTGDLSATLRVQYSDNLTNWTVLSLLPVLKLPADLRDERPLSAEQRYYRVVSP